MTDLASKTCVPCSGGVPRLEGEAILDYAKELGEWEVVDEHHLLKKYKFDDFKTSLDFINRIGEVAEREGHHPDIRFGWGYAEIVIFTHAIDGLSESDFVLAAKIDEL